MSEWQREAPTGPDRADWRHLLLLLAVVLALWAPRLQGPIDLRWDGAVYYVTGTSLAEGHGYRLLNEPGLPEAVQYPPVLPLLVAAVQSALGTSDSVRVGQALRLLYLLISLAYVAGSYLLARRFVRPGYALLVGALVALHHDTLFHSDLLFTEIPFGLIAVLFVLAAGSGRTLLAGGLGAAAFLLRSAGLALLVAWIGEAVLSRQPRQVAARLLLAAVPVLGWQVYVHGVVTSPGYREPAYAYQRAPYQYYNVPYAENLRLRDPFRPEQGTITRAQMASRALVNGLQMPERLGDGVSIPVGYWESFFYFGGWGAYPIRAARLALGLVVLAGLGWLAWRRSWLVPLIVAGSAALTAATPWPSQYGRYLTPLIPLLALGFGVALAEGGRRLGPRVRPLVPALAGAVLLLQVVTVAFVLSTRRFPVDYVDRSGSTVRQVLFYYYPPWTAFDRALAWLSVNTDPGDVVAAADAHVAFQRIGRQAVLPPMESDPDEAQRLLDSVPVDYLVIDQGQTLDVALQYAEPVVRVHPDKWTLVYESGVRIYRRDRERGGE